MSDIESVQPETKVAFVDSSAIIALVNREDTIHSQAVDAYHELVNDGYRLFTTNYVVAETVLLIDIGFGPDAAREWLRDHRLPVYHADDQDERRAIANITSSRRGSRISMTDAISTVVMERLGISDAFAVDPDFLADT